MTTPAVIPKMEPNMFRLLKLIAVAMMLLPGEIIWHGVILENKRCPDKKPQVPLILPDVSESVEAGLLTNILMITTVRMLTKHSMMTRMTEKMRKLRSQLLMWQLVLLRRAMNLGQVSGIKLVRFFVLRLCPPFFGKLWCMKSAPAAAAALMLMRVLMKLKTTSWFIVQKVAI